MLRAMYSVASAGGTEPLSDADRRGIAAAAHTVFGRDGDVDPDLLEVIGPAALGQALSDADAELRLDTVRLLAVMAFVDAVIEDPKLARVLTFAQALQVEEDFVTAISRILEDDVCWAAYDEIRHNVATIPGMPWNPEDPFGPFLPYGNDPDPELVLRYEALADHPSGTLGKAFWEHYKANDFAFPGDPLGVAEVWGTPHDCLHILSGYSTSAQGELLVATFTGGMQKHDDDMMESHVLPVILIYHMGIDFNKGLNKGDPEHLKADPGWRDNYQGNVHLGLDPAKLWVAWERGKAMTADLYDGQWSFFDHVDQTVADLRAAYGIPALDPRDADLPDGAIHRDEYLRVGMTPPPELGPSIVNERPTT